MPSLSALRQQLAAVTPPPRVDGSSRGAVPTGIPALDGALTDGGLPCGRLTEVLGVRGGGKTTLVRQLVAGGLAAGRWVAYVDGSRTLAPRDWAGLGDTGRLWVVRPPDAGRSAWCADVLLRSGAFGIVVLDGVPPLSRPVAIRLTRLARDRDAALVVVGEGPSGTMVGSAVRLRVERTGPGDRGGTGRGFFPPGDGGRRPRRWRGVPGARSLGTGGPRAPDGTGPPARGLRILVEKGGRLHSVEVGCAIEVARRLCAYPEVPDRRGVATRNRRGEKVGAPPRPPGPGAANAPHGSTLARKRRCAEPAVSRDAFLLTPHDGPC
jgi:recombination protein RecA